MFNASVFMFIVGWIVWFTIDKYPASLGLVIPEELDSLTANFQMAFDMLKAGYLRGFYVFIWKAHYLVLSVISGVLLSIMFDAFTSNLRRRNLHQIMWPKRITSGMQDTDDRGDQKEPPQK